MHWYGKKRRVKDEKTNKIRIIQTDRSQWIAVAVPAIVSREMWEAARAQAARNERQSTRNAQRYFLLRGLLRCSACNGGVYGSHDHGKACYRCKGTYVQKRTSPVRPECRGRLNAAWAENAVWDTIKGMLRTPAQITRAVRAKQIEFKPIQELLEGQLQSVTARLVEIETQRVRLLDAYLTAGSTLTKDIFHQRGAVLKTQLDDYTAEQSKIAAQLASVEIPENALKEILTFCKKIRTGLDRIDDPGKRQILELLNVSVTVLRGTTPPEDALLIMGYFPPVQVKQPGRIASQTG